MDTNQLFEEIRKTAEVGKGFQSPTQRVMAAVHIQNLVTGLIYKLGQGQ